MDFRTARSNVTPHPHYFSEKNDQEDPNTVHINQLRRVVKDGSDVEKEKALVDLLKLCQNENLSPSIVRDAKLLLVDLLKKLVPAEAENVTDDVDLQIINGLKTYVFLELKKAAAPMHEWPRYVHTCTRKNHTMCDLINKLQPIYFYLYTKVEHLDDQLFDEAGVLFVQKKFEAAWAIFNILSHSSNTLTKKEAKKALNGIPNEIPSEESDSYRYRFVHNQAYRPEMLYRPKTAFLYAQFYLVAQRNSPDIEVRMHNEKIVCWRVKHNEWDMEQDGIRNAVLETEMRCLLLLAKSAAQGYEPAINALKEFPDQTHYAEPLYDLSQVYGDDRFEKKMDLVQLDQLNKQGCFARIKDLTLAISLRERAQKIEATKKREKDAFESAFQLVQRDQQKRFGIGVLLSVQTRIIEARDSLERKDCFKGAEMLESLSKLPHPLAPEAQKILEEWLSNPHNRLELIKQYREASRRAAPESDQYKNKLQSHITIFCLQAHDLAQQYLNGKNGKKSDIKAAELLIQAADNGHQPSKDALKELINTTTCPATQYKLSQVITTLLMNELGDQGEEIAATFLLNAARKGHDEAKIVLAAKDNLSVAIQKAKEESERAKNKLAASLHADNRFHQSANAETYHDLL